MTKEEFDNLYEIIPAESAAGAVVYFYAIQVRRKRDGETWNVARMVIPEQEINDMVLDTNAPLSLTPYNRNEIIDQAKRYALDVVSRAFQITDWFPLNTATPI